MRRLIRRFCSCERGAGLVEYGLLLGLVALGLTVVLHLYRGAVGDVTNRTATTISQKSASGYGRWHPYKGGGDTPANPESPEPSADSVAAGGGPSCPGSGDDCTLAGRETAR
jgi:Flp pilus assembly pilin Flp